jgi:hypothetical protein
MPVCNILICGELSLILEQLGPSLQKKMAAEVILMVCENVSRKNERTDSLTLW